MIINNLMLGTCHNVPSTYGLDGIGELLPEYPKLKVCSPQKFAPKQIFAEKSKTRY